MECSPGSSKRDRTFRRQVSERVRSRHRAHQALHVVLVQVNVVACHRGRWGLGWHVLFVDVEVQEHVVGAGHLAAEAHRALPLDGDALGELVLSSLFVVDDIISLVGGGVSVLQREEGGGEGNTAGKVTYVLRFSKYFSEHQRVLGPIETSTSLRLLPSLQRLWEGTATDVCRSHLLPEDEGLIDLRLQQLPTGYDSQR